MTHVKLSELESMFKQVGGTTLYVYGHSTCRIY